jgi:ArsR family transcriptional regulator, arsenate/arsenite/antimonite-responsive transcriptional repressor
MSKPLDGNAMERLLQALGDRTRLRILNLMKDEEVCVCFFVGSLEALQPKISRHLAYLRKAGLVSARREGKWMHYSLRVPEDPDAAEVVRSVLAWAERDPEMRKDRMRYKAVCCTPAPLVSLSARSKATAREQSPALAETR